MLVTLFGITKELFIRNAIEVLDGGDDTDELYDSLIEKAHAAIKDYGWESVFDSWQHYMFENCHTVEDALSFATWFYTYGGHEHRIEKPYPFLAYLYNIFDLNPENTMLKSWTMYHMVYLRQRESKQIFGQMTVIQPRRIQN